MGIRCADHVTPLYPQNLALISPTGGGRSVGIVRSRTKATERFIMTRLCLINGCNLTYLTTPVLAAVLLLRSSSSRMYVNLTLNVKALRSLETCWRLTSQHGITTQRAWNFGSEEAYDSSWFTLIRFYCEGRLDLITYMNIEHFVTVVGLTHWGRVTQICVFTLQLCKTDDPNLRF